MNSFHRSLRFKNFVLEHHKNKKSCLCFLIKSDFTPDEVSHLYGVKKIFYTKVRKSLLPDGF